MGCENLIIARTDSESGRLLSSAIDVRDHDFILGVNEVTRPLAETIQEMEAGGASGAEIDEFEAVWVKNHRLVTFDEGEFFWLSRSLADSMKLSSISSKPKVQAKGTSRNI